ncbi:MotE family protein [Paenibacillus marinisediminis]
MALVNEETEEKEKRYSIFERILLFATPIFFTIILLGGLLMLVNDEWRNNVLVWADEVPVLNKLVPEPDKPAEAKKKETKEAEQKPSESEQIKDLKELLASKDNDLRVLADKKKELEGQVDTLTQQVKELQNKDEQKRLTAEEYAQEVKDLANMYAKMMPSKAAPVMENLTIDEMVLVFDSMNTESRVKIMEKMNPKIAAEVSIRLKDVTTAENMQIAALQSRLNKQEAEGTPQTELDSTQLSKTFASMPAKSAADIILETAKISEQKAIAILNNVDDATRSKLISAMTEADKVATAKLVSKILPNK